MYNAQWVLLQEGKDFLTKPGSPIYAIVLIGLAVVGAGNTLGFGHWWTQTSLVRRFPWLA